MHKILHFVPELEKLNKHLIMEGIKDSKQIIKQVNYNYYKLNKEEVTKKNKYLRNNKLLLNYFGYFFLNN